MTHTIKSLNIQIKNLIDNARKSIVQTVNSTMTHTYYKKGVLGNSILENIPTQIRGNVREEKLI